MINRAHIVIVLLAGIISATMPSDARAQDSPGVARPISSFGLDVFRHVASSVSEPNIVFSPLSVGLATALLAEGHLLIEDVPGVGKTMLATALGHAAVRRRFSVHFERCDRLLKRLRASRVDNSHDAEIRKLLRVDLLLIDDFALQPMDSVDTADIYELIVERHRAAATVVTSNREPVEWLGLMADPLLAQSAIDRLQSAAHELVLDGESYRQRQKPTVTDGLDDPPAPRRSSRRRT